MTREQQQSADPRYDDWRAAYREDVVERVKHWGDKRKSGKRSNNGSMQESLNAPGRGE